jgi:hypothetical protein
MANTFDKHCSFNIARAHFSGKRVRCRSLTAALVIFVCSNCRHRSHFQWLKLNARRACGEIVRLTT